MASARLTAPGIAGEVGSSLDFNRLAYMGLFLSPLITQQALKGAIFASQLFKDLGYCVSPQPEEPRTDIIQALKLESPEKCAFLSRHSKASPIDAHVTPQESLLPGYEDPVIMAGGTFVQGSSIELSADGPLREPYIIYLQGGLSLSHILIGLAGAIKQIEVKLMTKEIILILILLLGVAGTLIPFLPGIPIMFLAILLYSFLDGWVNFSPFFVAIVGIFTLITFFIDYLGSYWGIKKLGASKAGIWGGIIGSIVGIFSMGPLGLLIGPVIGVVVGELLAGKDFIQAFKVSLGNFVGLLGSALLQLIIALAILFWAIFKLF